MEDPNPEALGECFGFCDWTGLPWSPAPLWHGEGFGERSSSFRLHKGGRRESHAQTKIAGEECKAKIGHTTHVKAASNLLV